MISLKNILLYKNQLTIEPDTTKNARFSNHVDSDSVIVTEQNNVIGLLFAGTENGLTTFGNLVSDVEIALDVSIYTDVFVHM